MYIPNSSQGCSDKAPSGCFQVSVHTLNESRTQFLVDRLFLHLLLISQFLKISNHKLCSFHFYSRPTILSDLQGVLFQQTVGYLLFTSLQLTSPIQIQSFSFLYLFTSPYGILLATNIKKKHFFFHVSTIARATLQVSDGPPISKHHWQNRDLVFFFFF